MTALINIGSTALPVVEYRGERVVTLAMVDQAHQRPEGTARRNFNENRPHLVEGEDFFEIDQADEIRTLGISRPQGGVPAKIVIFTESGYLMLVKSFTDDQAWDVQRKLVRSYFAKTSHTARPQRQSVNTTTEALKLTPLAVKAARAFGLDKNSAAISANQLVRKLTGVNLLEDFTPTELGARISVSGAKMNQQLAAAGLQARQGKGWEPTQAGKEFSRIFDTGKKQGSGTPIQQIKWAATVMEVIAR